VVQSNFTIDDVWIEKSRDKEESWREKGKKKVPRVMTKIFIANIRYQIKNKFINFLLIIKTILDTEIFNLQNII